MPLDFSNLADLSPVQMLPGGQDPNALEKPSLPELLLNVFGAGEIARRKPLGAMLETLGAAFGDARQQRGLSAQQKAIGTALGKIPGMENIPPALVMSNPQVFGELLKMNKEDAQQKRTEELLGKLGPAPGADTPGGGIAMTGVDPDTFRNVLAFTGDPAKAYTQARMIYENKHRDDRQDEQFKRTGQWHDDTNARIQQFHSEAEADRAQRRKDAESRDAQHKKDRTASGQAAQLTRQATLEKEQIGILSQQLKMVDANIKAGSAGMRGMFGDSKQVSTLRDQRAAIAKKMDEHAANLAEIGKKNAALGAVPVSAGADEEDVNDTPNPEEFGALNPE